MKLRAIDVSLDQLYLDPNNYRFIDQPEYSFVEDKDIPSSIVQKKTMRFLLGPAQDGIKDLIDSIRTNGFLEFEQIQVRTIAPGKYVVVEGNRRVATLKFLKKQFEAEGSIEELLLGYIQSITVSLIDGFDERDNYIAMGLQHIGGKKKWSPLNQARLLRDLLEKQHMNETEICNSLGISRSAIRTRLRALSLADLYMMSDYGDQFRSDMFSFFEEIMKRTELRLWLNWDDSSQRCNNQLNQERLFNWISFIEEDDEHARQEPIIMKSAEIRELAGFINDEKAIQMMESTRSFSEGKMFITIGTSKNKQSIEKLYKEARSLSENEVPLSESDFRSLKIAFERLKSILSIDKVETSQPSTERLSVVGSCGFTSVHIAKFRGISNLDISDLSRINLFVGDNNSGKTSVLEAIYLLTQMNNLNKYLDIEKFRARVETGYSPSWMSDYLDKYYNLSGFFGGNNYYSEYKQQKEESFELDKLGYLTTLYSMAGVENSLENYQMKIHLYEQKQPVSLYDRVVCICPSSFSSAFRRDKDSLLEAWNTVIDNNQKDILVKFICENFDKNIVDVNLSGEKENYRFMVTSKDVDKAIDITKYGEGLQRVLEISLYVVACADGCAFVDEIDSAVHKRLLNAFIRYIAEICKKFNVQLFASTHNRECVDSFIRIKEEVTAYKLKRDRDQIKVIHSDAISLWPLLEEGNIDIR